MFYPTWLEMYYRGRFLDNSGFQNSNLYIVQPVFQVKIDKRFRRSFFYKENFLQQLMANFFPVVNTFIAIFHIIMWRSIE